ncbi:inorganic pyrophosphatase, partial [Perkinsus olseni]
MITVDLGILRSTVQDSKQLDLRDAMDSSYLLITATAFVSGSCCVGDHMAIQGPESSSRKSRSRYPTIVALSLLGLLFYSSLSLLQWVRSAPRKALESVWSSHGSSEEFGIISVGQAGTTSYELECCTHALGSSSGCQPMSFWHDVPLYVGEDEEGLIRMVVEIPRFTRAKMEINRESYKYPAMNPIRQDLF